MHSSSPVIARFKLLSLLLACVMLPTSTVRSDAASGTYTGSISARGNYYWEKSTRVIAPSASVNLATPSGVRLEGAYLLDAITSASTATGVIVDKAFTEKRNEGHAGVGYEVEIGDKQLDLSVSGRVSKEPDYLSRGVGFGAALSLDQRNTVLRLNGYFISDEISRIVRGPVEGQPNVVRAQRAVHQGDLWALSVGVGWDQVLSPRTTLSLGYDLAKLNGLQSNVYRTVDLIEGGQRVETHPDARTRHAGYVWLSHFVTNTRTALRLGYRLYYDTWELLAHVPELRIHQELGEYLELRLRYRVYTQNSSFFYRPRGMSSASATYVTDDPKMSRFHDQTLGYKLRLSLAFLDFTALRALRTAVIDWSAEYVLNTNRYGNGFIAQGGVMWAF